MKKHINMHKGRLEAFSDGVIAIIITIMVLELKVPHTVDVAALKALLPVFISYILSFIYVGIYWNNHHHMFQIVKQVDGPVLWANIHLLFWLSLIPFVTAWAGENHFETLPVFLYGCVLIMCSVAYFILVKTLLRLHDNTSELATAMGKDIKGKISTGIYIVGTPAAFISPWISIGSYILVAIIWLIPDSRVEDVITEN